MYYNEQVPRRSKETAREMRNVGQ